MSAAGGDAVPARPRFLVIVKVRIDRPYAYWAAHFDAHAPARRGLGIVDRFRAPVVGEQAIVYGVETDRPREVLDMMYIAGNLEHIRASGHVIGSEQFTLCELD